MSCVLHEWCTHNSTPLLCAHTVCPVINSAEGIDFLFTGIHKWKHIFIRLPNTQTHF